MFGRRETKHINNNDGKKRLWNFLFNFMFVTRLYLWVLWECWKTQMSKKISSMELDWRTRSAAAAWWLMFESFSGVLLGLEEVDQIFHSTEDTDVSLPCLAVKSRLGIKILTWPLCQLILWINSNYLKKSLVLLQFSIPFRVCNFLKLFLPFILSLFCYTIWFIIIEWSFRFAFFRSHSARSLTCTWFYVCLLCPLHNNRQIQNF